MYIIVYKIKHRNARLSVCSMYKLIKKPNIVSLFILRKKERDDNNIRTILFYD